MWQPADVLCGDGSGPFFGSHFGGHAHPDLTADTYMQEIPEGTRLAVEQLDQELFGKVHHRNEKVN